MRTEKELKNLSKAEQVELLTFYGLKEDEIKKLRYEKDRVSKILELQDKVHSKAEEVVDKVEEPVKEEIKVEPKPIRGVICKKCGAAMVLKSRGPSMKNYICSCGAKHSKSGGGR